MSRHPRHANGFTAFFLAMLLAAAASAASPQHTDSLRQRILRIIDSRNARVGVAILGSNPADTLFINGDRHCPMQSVFKFHLALAVLRRVDERALSLDQKIHVTAKDLLPRTWSPLRERYPKGNVNLPLSEILRATVSESDNNGCDILFRLIGGPAAVDSCMRHLGIHDVAIVANEEEMHRAWDVQYRNWTTPRAALELLAGFRAGRFLSGENNALLWRFMVETSTGPKRIKGLLPKGTIVAHKTGSSGANDDGLSAATNDIGIIVLPDGREVLIAVFVSDSREPDGTNERIIADVARAAWEHFSGERACTIVVNGESPYRIVIPALANDVERKAAEELQKFILKMSDVQLPVVDDTAGVNPCEILIGRNNRVRRLIPGFDGSGLEEDGFRLVTAGQKLLIVGGSRKGTLYGVYALLEEVLGCRMYTASVNMVPRQRVISIPPLDTTQVPFIRFRQVHYLNAMDRAYSDWHKLHSLADQQESWGMWVHTFERLVPAQVHFAEHPEYFSLVGGRRIPNGQLCLSHPALFDVLTTSLRAAMARQPSARIWSVSQNDNFNECQCDSCRARNERYGGSSGTMLALVNRVADTFPGKTISTLAYQYTRSAPRGIAPDSNVNIMLCSIECNRSEPIATDVRSASFRKDVEDWAGLTDNILMWDYVVQFRNYVSPFPNLRVLQPNIQFFVRNNIRMMFQQGSGHSVTEFGELRTYLIAKLLWDPFCDVDAHMNDFLAGYYGPAGTYLRAYIDSMHDALERSGDVLDIYGYPYDAIDSYLTPALIEEYSRLFDEAERVVSDQPELLDRVKTARLPLEFAILDIALHDVNPDLSYFDKHDGRWTPKPAMRRRLDAFVAQAKKAGIERLEESGRSPDEYKASVEQQMHVSVEGNLAFGKPVTLLTPHSEKYPAGGGKALTDGLHGPNDYHCNWLGFEAEHLDAVIDLGRDTSFSSMSMSFLQMWYAWIWMPLKVDVAISADGRNFSSVATLVNSVPDTTSGVFKKDFRVDVGTRRARYVKVTAQSRLQCPEWHIGAGQKCWMFIDEIVIR
ncbi:MAG: class A beta-lactamase, subclass A2 [Bacteroidetes bacterium]|nr:class A beta-lactamase, subclass A2 [Bacteroidota bacterium]